MKMLFTFKKKVFQILKSYQLGDLCSPNTGTPENQDKLTLISSVNSPESGEDPHIYF